MGGTKKSAERKQNGGKPPVVDDGRRKSYDARAPQRKKGNQKQKTEGSHKVPHSVFEEALRHGPGPAPKEPKKKQAAAAGINNNKNITVKSKYSNQIRDARRDKEVLQAFHEKRPARTKECRQRASQQIRTLRKLARNEPDARGQFNNAARSLERIAGKK